MTKGEYITFELDDYQEELFKHLGRNRFTIIRKPRQVFTTSMLATYVAWVLLHSYTDDPKVVIYVANKYFMSKRFAKLVRVVITNYCNDRGLDIDKTIVNNASDRLILSNGSELIISSNATNSIKGFTPDEIIFDECAFIDGFGEAMGATLAALQPMSKMILASTPNGYETFRDIYVSAVAGENDFKPFRIRWDDVSSRDESWLTDMKGALNSDRMIRQELYAEFLEPIKIVTRKSKEKVVQVRIDTTTYSKLSERLISLDLSQSDYLRNLIINDLG